MCLCVVAEARAGLSDRMRRGRWRCAVLENAEAKRSCEEDITARIEEWKAETAQTCQQGLNQASKSYTSRALYPSP